MTENAELVLETLCEEDEKGKACKWESINAVRVNLSKADFISACEEFRAEGILPNFTTTKPMKGKERICYLGTPSNEIINVFKEIKEEETTNN